MFSRFIHAAVFFIISFFLLLIYSTGTIDHISFTQSFVDEHVHYSHLLATVNSAALNIHM